MKISIPHPCHENWQEMIPNEQGRFCDSCQKTVVDFTDWTDKAIFNFISQHNGKVCGRFTVSQLDAVKSPQLRKPRPVYPVAIAMAVASLFAQPPVAHAQQAKTHQTSISKKQEASQRPHLSLQGTVTGKNSTPLANVHIRLLDYRLKPVGSTTTNSAGQYSIVNLKPDIYSIEFVPQDTAYASQSNAITIQDNEPATFNAALMLKSDQGTYIMGDVETGVPEMKLKKK